MYRILLLSVSLLFVSRTAAQDPDALRQRFANMREAYTERMQQFDAEFEKLEKEEVNRFIIALVRTEQAFRDDGDLTGVLLTRRLQEEMLESQRFPSPDPEFPERIQSLLSETRQTLETGRQEIQEKVDALKRTYAERLEPVMRDLTRAGDFETAREMLDIRNEIFASLDLQQDLRPTHRTVDQLRAPNDPNTFPVLFEPEGLKNNPGLPTRRPQLAFHPRIEGNAEAGPERFELRGGRITIPAHASEALLHQIQQTQSFTLEIGFQTANPLQNGPILSFGPTPEEANLAILHQNQHLILLLRTTSQAGETILNRVNLGAANPGRMQHLIITYRPGDLAVYRNGSNTRRNRADASGDLRSWEMKPILIGSTDTVDPALPPSKWHGTLVNLSLSATPFSSRQVTTSFERFVSFISAR